MKSEGDFFGGCGGGYGSAPSYPRSKIEGVCPPKKEKYHLGIILKIRLALTKTKPPNGDCTEENYYGR